MTNRHQQDDEAPELRRLLDEINGPATGLDDSDDGPPDEIDVSTGFNEEQTPVYGQAKSERLRLQQSFESERAIVPDRPAADGARNKSTPRHSESGSSDSSQADTDEHLTGVVEGRPQIESAEELEPTNLALDIAPARITPPQEARGQLERIPVTMDCCLRSINKTLGEVSQLKEREIVLLGRGADAPIELRANGRVFAFGRLVMVEDELAVEITEVISAP